MNTNFSEHSSWTLFLSLTPLPVKSLNFRWISSKPNLVFLSPLYQRREYQAVFISQGSKLDPVFYSSTPPQKGDLWGDFPATQSWRTRRCKCQSGSTLHSIKAGIGLCSPPVDCPSNEERLNHNSKRFTTVYVAVGGPCGVIIPSG